MMSVKWWGVHFLPYIENEVLKIPSVGHFLILVRTYKHETDVYPGRLAN